MSTSMLWYVVLVAALGTYLLKLAGLSVPAAALEQPLVARTVALIPAALLAALVAVNAFTRAGAFVLDFRLAALAGAAVALALRAPFIVVLLVAGGVGALGYVVAG